MQRKKKNLLEKIVKKDYNNELEKILEEKQFDENVKNCVKVCAFCWKYSLRYFI